MDRDQILARMSEDVRGYIDPVMGMYEAPFAREMGVEVESIDAEKVVVSMDLRPGHLNSMGRGHGGAVYTLMDHAFAIAANMVRPCTGQSSNVSFHRPATGRITAVCTLVNRSRSLEVHDVRAYNEEGKLVASGTFTAFALEVRRCRTGAAPTAASWCRPTASPAPSATGRYPWSPSRPRSRRGSAGGPAARGRP